MKIAELTDRQIVDILQECTGLPTYIGGFYTGPTFARGDDFVITSNHGLHIFIYASGNIVCDGDRTELNPIDYDKIKTMLRDFGVSPN